MLDLEVECHCFAGLAFIMKAEKTAHVCIDLSIRLRAKKAQVCIDLSIGLKAKQIDKTQSRKPSTCPQHVLASGLQPSERKTEPCRRHTFAQYVLASG